MLCLNVGADAALEVSKMKVKLAGASYLRSKLRFIRASSPARAAEVYAKLPELLCLFEVELTPLASEVIAQVRKAHPKSAVLLHVTADELKYLPSAFGADVLVLTTSPKWLPFEFETHRTELAERFGLESGEFIRLCKQATLPNASCCASDIIMRLAGRYGYIRTFVSAACESGGECRCIL